MVMQKHSPQVALIIPIKLISKPGFGQRTACCYTLATFIKIYR